MTTQTASRQSIGWIVVCLAAGVPAFVLRISGAHLDPVVVALIYGLGIVAGAFLLSWAAEVAQLDISASFAIAILALIALLPEYAIEAVLAWKAGASFEPGMVTITPEIERVAANVTGSNRPARRSGVVPGDSNLLDQASPGFGPAWLPEPGDRHAHLRHPCHLPYLLHGRGPLRGGGCADQHLPPLPLDKLDPRIGGARAYRSGCYGRLAAQEKPPNSRRAYVCLRRGPSYWSRQSPLWNLWWIRAWSWG